MPSEKLSPEEALEQVRVIFKNAWPYSQDVCNGHGMSGDQTPILAMLLTLAATILVLADATSKKH